MQLGNRSFVMNITNSSLYFHNVHLIWISKNILLSLVKSTSSSSLHIHVNKMSGLNYFPIQNKQDGIDFIWLYTK